MIECATLAILSPMRCSQASDGPFLGLLGGVVKLVWELLAAVDTGPFLDGTAARWGWPCASTGWRPGTDWRPPEVRRRMTTRSPGSSDTAETNPEPAVSARP
mgnify:CR=1 FL=1